MQEKRLAKPQTAPLELNKIISLGNIIAYQSANTLTVLNAFYNSTQMVELSCICTTSLTFLTKSDTASVSLFRSRAGIIQDHSRYCEHFLGRKMPYGNKKAAIECRFFAQS